ncbi:MAG TPA: acyl-CoA reductase, partial [Thermoanaerobaculia bacterium]|nr:acyl-CoA reductase [Thermoanaerobaculia bacterium]
QSLLPALAVGRPVIAKSPSEEPFFAPAFAAALSAADAHLAAALAVLRWRGGDDELETVVLDRAGRILAYGDETSTASLARRGASKTITYGPKASLAVVGETADLGRAAAGLARDVALFDQRGCLSVHAVFTASDATKLAGRLAEELSRLAETLPPGPAVPSEVAGLRQALAEAELRGLEHVSLGWPTSGHGTVIVDPEPHLRPSPGLRCVRVHPLPDLSRLPGLLASWSGKLQGAALAGEGAWELVPALTALGFSRFTAPGDLQATDALWFNGGIDPLAALS